MRIGWTLAWVGVLLISSTASADPLTLPRPDWGRVRVTGERGAVLERFTIDTGGAWLPVCVAPCVGWVPRDAVVRFDGEGMMTSKPLLLREDDVELSVTRRSPLVRGIGIASMILGAVGVGAGIVYLGFERDPSPSQAAWGVALLLTGLTSFVVGLALTVVNGSSPVVQLRSATN